MPHDPAVRIFSIRRSRQSRILGKSLFAPETIQIQPIKKMGRSEREGPHAPVIPGRIGPELGRTAVNLRVMGSINPFSRTFALVAWGGGD